MLNRMFGQSSSSGCKERKDAELSDGPSSSASLQDAEAKHSRKDLQQVNDSLDRLGKQPDVLTMQILFFHGLPLEDFSNVHFRTWDNGDGVIWPQAWLVEEFPGAQIFFVKYGAALENSEVFTMNNIGENLISDLLEANIGQVQDCPVVLVGHCVGGLVIKELCWKAHEERCSSHTSINDRAKKLEAFLDRVRGIFYYSTPHHGIREIPKGYRFRFNAIFKYFETLSTEASVLNMNFSKLCTLYKWKIEGVGESLRVKLGVFQNVLVVTEASARDGVQIFNVLKEEDHFSMCKPKTITSGGFYHLTRMLGNIAKEEVKLREETRHKSLEIELKAGLPPENFQIISKGVVGIQIPLQAVIEELKAVSTLGLTGMGGSGKTTLAKALFNELGCSFEYTCFVPDVKLIKGTVETVKEKVWEHVYCNGKKVGGEMRWPVLRGKRLLLVLDDIEHVRDTTVLSDIAEGGPSLESGFIATSRDDDLFEVIYKVPRLDETNHDTELFMSYAFSNNETPSPQLRSLTKKIVKKCEGLPLTLEVLGKWLRKTKDVVVWKQTLTALDKAGILQPFDERLWAKLRPSIIGLGEDEKKMFLDATTFFFDNLWTLREAKAAWRVTYNISDLLWRILVDRSLVYDVHDDDYIKVHEQLRSLGRKIADESKAYIDIRTLEDFEILQSSNELEKKNIRTLRIKVGRPDGEKNHPRQSTLDDKDPDEGDWDDEDLDDEDSDDGDSDDGNSDDGDSDDEDSDDEDSEQSLFEDAKVDIASLALQELKELRYLDVDNHGEIDGAAEAILFPRRLVLLRCVGLNTLSLAHQRRLVVLSISGVKSLPNAIGQLSALRIFTLCDCANLRALPNSFGKLSALERLLFDDCAIETLPESFGKLSALKYLRFRCCSGLESLPKSFGLLAALVDLIFDDCRSLESLPNTFGHLPSLSRLEFEWCTSLKSLPESFGKLSSLKYLRFRHCLFLKSLPDSFGLLGALADLEFEGCGHLKSLPNTFGHLSALSRLELSSCYWLESLPESFGELSALKYLRFESCSLESLPESFGLLAALVDLKFEYCESLESLPNTFGHLPSLSRLELTECPGLRNLPESLGNLPVLRHLKLSSCYDLDHLPESLGRLAKLEYLEIDYLVALKRLPNSVADLGSLRHLTFTQLSSLKSIPDYIRNLPSLQTLELGMLPYLKELPPWLGETGVNWSGLSRKVFRIQDRQFCLTSDETVHVTEAAEFVRRIHSRAMRKVRTLDYDGALAALEVFGLGIPKLDGFLLQEKGIIKRMTGDLDGALEDLTAALECFSKVDDGTDYSYDCWKQRANVNFLMGRVDAAENDGTMALKLPPEYRTCVCTSGDPSSRAGEDAENFDQLRWRNACIFDQEVHGFGADFDLSSGRYAYNPCQFDWGF